MTLNITNLGEQVAGSTSQEATSAPRTRASHNTGMIVVFAAIPGLTLKGVLTRPLVLQVAPIDEFGPDYEWAWTDYDTIDSGMHSNPQSPQLTTITFNSMFVDDDTLPFVITPYGGHILSAIKTLKRIGDSMTPFQMQAGQPQLWGQWEPLGHAGQASLPVTLRSFKPVEKAGESDARYYSITVTEFPDAPKLRDIQVPIASSGATASGSSSSAPGPSKDPQTGMQYLAVLDVSHLLPSASTFRDISKAYYGNYSDWPLIAKASGLQSIPPDANLTDLADAQPAPKIYVPAKAS